MQILFEFNKSLSAEKSLEIIANEDYCGKKSYYRINDENNRMTVIFDIPDDSGIQISNFCHRACEYLNVLDLKPNVEFLSFQ